MADIIVRVKNKIQFQEVLAFDQVNRVIADFSCAALDIETIRKEHPEKKFYLQLPDVLREKKAESVARIAEKAKLFDGIVIKNIDEMGLLKEILKAYEGSEATADLENWQLIGDSFLYAYNTSALSFYRSHFPAMQFILSDELTDREAQQLILSAENEVGISPEEFICKVYGYQPLMITNQCLNRNYAGCEKPLMQFADEKKHQFYITSECGQCYDIVYNGQPTCMLDKLTEAPDGFEMDGFVYQNILIDFTIEPEAEVRRILSGFFGGEKELCLNFTRGHHYKGVE